MGTTHSALCYVNLGTSDGEQTDHGVLANLLLTNPGKVAELPLLPFLDFNSGAPGFTVQADAILTPIL